MDFCEHDDSKTVVMRCTKSWGRFVEKLTSSGTLVVQCKDGDIEQECRLPSHMHFPFQDINAETVAHSFASTVSHVLHRPWKIVDCLRKKKPFYKNLDFVEIRCAKFWIQKVSKLKKKTLFSYFIFADKVTSKPIARYNKKLCWLQFF